MNIKCAHTELVKINDLIPNPKNPNKHPDEQIKLLSKIIDQQGQRAPIVVSKRSGFITKGHGRLMAIEKLGWERAAVDYQEYESEAMEYADMIADNKIAELATTDMAMVLEDLGDIELEDLDLLGIPDFEIPEVVEPQCDEDDMPENVPTKTELGDVYVLGEHRLVCGDSTSVTDVDKLMDGQKADMVFTDPPYGMSLHADYSNMINKDGIAGNSHKNIIGDDDDFDPSFIQSFYGYCDEIILFGADYYAERIEQKNQGSWLVWDKRVEEKYDKVIGSAFELIWSKKKKKREIIRYDYSSWGNRMKDNLNGKKPHPTMKPIGLLEKMFEKLPYGLCIDLFGGSGSTLIACEKTKRKCFMMELDPYYCDVIVSRWVKYTGKSKVIRNGEEIDWDVASQ